jgi:hypothetical protein
MAERTVSSHSAFAGCRASLLQGSNFLMQFLCLTRRSCYPIWIVGMEPPVRGGLATRSTERRKKWKSVRDMPARNLKGELRHGDLPLRFSSTGI